MQSSLIAPAERRVAFRCSCIFKRFSPPKTRSHDLWAGPGDLANNPPKYKCAHTEFLYKVLRIFKVELNQTPGEGLIFLISPDYSISQPALVGYVVNINVRAKNYEKGLRLAAGKALKNSLPRFRVCRSAHSGVAEGKWRHAR